MTLIDDLLYILVTVAKIVGFIVLFIILVGIL